MNFKINLKEKEKVGKGKLKVFKNGQYLVKVQYDDEAMQDKMWL